MQGIDTVPLLKNSFRISIWKTAAAGMLGFMSGALIFAEVLGLGWGGSVSPLMRATIALVLTPAFLSKSLGPTAVIILTGAWSTFLWHVLLSLLIFGARLIVQLWKVAFNYTPQPVSDAAPETSSWAASAIVIIFLGVLAALFLKTFGF
jgi:hypothetical protein